MHDDWIVAIALCVSGIGIVLLLFALILLEPPQTDIPGAIASADGAPVRITGTLTGVRAIGERTILTITQPSTIDAVVESTNLTDLAIGDCIAVRGERSSYEGRAQVSATRVVAC
jgi:hypothetical protein